MESVKELEDRLQRLIKKRNKQIRIAGLASKQTVDAISKLRLIINNIKNENKD